MNKVVHAQRSGGSHTDVVEKVSLWVAVAAGFDIIVAGWFYTVPNSSAGTFAWIGVGILLLALVVLYFIDRHKVKLNNTPLRDLRFD